MRQELHAARAVRIKECAERGLSMQEAAGHLGIHYLTVTRKAKELGIEFRRPNKGAADQERLQAVAAMYRSGKTLAEIGELYGVTRERIRQLLSRYTDVTATDGGSAAKARIERDKKRAEREAACLEKNGCSVAQLKHLRRIAREMMAAGVCRDKTPIQAFNAQRCKAKARGIAWNLKLWEWWTVWCDSGKWERRGRSGDGYVMCRFSDNGPYELGNVYIATLRHNSTVQPNNPYRKGHPNYDAAMAEKAHRRMSVASMAAAG